MWNTIVLNFSTSNVQTNHFKTISQKFGKILNSFARNHLVHVIWQFNTFCISAFLCDFCNGCNTNCYTFCSTNFYMCRKLTCIIGIFINFLIHFLLFFLCIIFRVYHFLTFGCFFPLAILLLLCIFVNILHVSCLFFTNSNDYNSSSGSVIFGVHNVRFWMPSK